MMNVNNNSRESNVSLLNGGRRRSRILQHFCRILVVLCIFLLASRRIQNSFVLQEPQQQQQQQHVSISKHSGTVVITTVGNTTSSTHEQQVSSSSTNPVTARTTTTSLLFVNHSADDDVFEQKEGCSSRHRCRLEFVHIPKAGGTAVELAGLVANISWGACRFFPTVWVNNQHKIPCPTMTTSSSSGGLMRIGPLRKRHRLPPPARRVNDWHMPPQYFDVKKFAKNGMNPYRHDKNDVDYDDVAIFAIVRDPYERAISEYYYTNKRNDIDDDDDPKNTNNNSRVHNATVMNRWLEMRLAPMLENYTNIVHGEPPLIAPMRPGEEKREIPRSSAVYYQQDGHFIPQYDYIFDGGGSGGDAEQQQQAARRVVHHVLHFEHLQTDFSKLMAAYNLSVVLPDPAEESKQQQQQQQKDNSGSGDTADAVVALVARKTRTKKLNKYNLTQDNIQRIETIYALDFATFGYPTISSEMEKE